MKAALLYGPGDLRVEDVPLPEKPEGWALVKTLAVGICGTDKAFYKGTYPLFKKPLIPGHEVSGVVVEGPEELVGRLVVSEINFPCWRCEYCRSGLYTHCPYKKTLGIDFDGGLAEYFVAPATALHAAEGLDPVVATEVEPLAALLNALRLKPPAPGDSVAVVGTGNLAVMLVQVLKDAGFRPVVVSRAGSSKAEILRSLDVEVVTAEQASRLGGESGDGVGFDVVFEVSGDPSALNLAVDLVKPRGTVHLKSTPGNPGSVNLTKAVVKEVAVIGSRCGTFREFREAIRLLREGRVRPVITSVYGGLEKAREAFERSFRPGEVKVVVKP
ncbi:MDR/zinc-dependent alcohol dehydrogenase-like family protein [Thermofilum pendens]|uniref:Alcohol dehydrogenase GroES domain protein n=1 Tax=Thermofilum pendens (strain DSM 2475 / Hrk 5) TaxID=368408 RepID=A1S0D3_THEPD|nr:alcohol dehydrogenase catalytic domain-containing protein [Thermofilum pendens]ABL78913.1 Alcohol dehydrogenase GroES domain protein [Thermofilum pendens Hrk 5]